jgi:hypothetical protein
MTAILSIIESNEEIKKSIQHEKPFSIVRLGIGSEIYLTYSYLLTNKIHERFLHPQLKTLYNAGIYTRDKNINKMVLFCRFYDRSIKMSDKLACFSNDNMIKIQDYFATQYNLEKIHSRSLEPFYASLENEIPWSQKLYGKKVLIIHPFVNSFQKQLKNNFKIFKDKNKQLFHPEQEFKFYKTFQTIAGNHIHNDWFETFTIMCNDIKNIDFDIALLGCGGYGLPLCDFIKSKLNKGAIYVGGGLQLMFGVMGKRWENNEMWKKIIQENDCKFIRPSQEEICPNLKTIEGGCYW